MFIIIVIHFVCCRMNSKGGQVFLVDEREEQLLGSLGELCHACIH